MPVKDTTALPPYFRLSDAELTQYRERGFDLLETSMEGKLSALFSSATIQGMCDVIGEAGTVPHDLVPTAKEWEVARDSAGPEEDLSALTDGRKRQQELFALFFHLTRGWRGHDIGPFRTMYFVHALNTTSFEVKDRMRFGGFPLPVNQPVQRYLQKFRGIYHCPPEALNWLAYDAFLSSVLSALQVRWLDLEDALLSAFVASLPASYRQLLRAQHVPEGLSPVFWRHDLEHFYRVNRYGEKTVAAAKTLSALVRRIGYAEDFAPYLERVEQVAQIPVWAIQRGSPLPELAEHIKHNPPTLKAMYKALSEALATRIEQGFGRNSFPNSAPDFIRKIYDGVAAGGGQKPAEFWKLCSDIAYHLPIIISRLPQYESTGDVVQPDSPTAEGFRSIVRARTGV